MIRSIELALLPEDAADQTLQIQLASSLLNIHISRIRELIITKRSIDARGRTVKIRLMADVYIDELSSNSAEQKTFSFHQDVFAARRVIIIGCGPAGMFAALKLIEQGLKPIIIERGKDVQQRRRDLAAINKQGIINEDSNYCFGEGGAGTYSDGKLYTRSSKRGDIHRILDILIHHGADPTIKIDAHPHIGTNKLPKIVQEIRTTILNAGGEIHFDTRLIDIIENQNSFQSVLIKNLSTGKEDQIEGHALILATGHSARDIYELFARKNWTIEAKPFALGV